MDLVTLIAACALRAQPDLFVMLGMDKHCAPPVAVAVQASAGAGTKIGQWEHYIAEASQRFGVPAQWVRDIMRAESGGRLLLNGRPITSPAGAMGLMQIMPRTYAELRQRYGLEDDPYDPRKDILAGTAYLREMYDRFGAPGFAAAYNAGPRRFAEPLQTGRALPAETRRYLAGVTTPEDGSVASPSGGDISLPSAPSAESPTSGDHSISSANASEPPNADTIRADDVLHARSQTTGDSALFVQPSRSARAKPLSSLTPPAASSRAERRAPGMRDDGLFIPLGTAPSPR